MKCIIIFGCLLVTVYGVSDDFKDKLMAKLAQIAEDCIPESGAGDEDIGELMEKKVPTRKEGKCLLACFNKKLGAIKDGKFDKDGSLAALEPLKSNEPELYGKLEQVINKCHEELSNDPETDECEIAAKLMVCSDKVSKEVGIDMEAVMG